ncbi:MAG: neocarzinostatin apoprotein domain-containing protein [Candidatus Limnocylindrales bacterium]
MRVIAVVLLISMVASGCSVLSTGPQITINPHANLLAGQSVTVQVSGLAIGSVIYLSECATAVAATDLGCGADLAVQVRLVGDDHGSVSSLFPVSTTASAGPGSTNALEACADQCVIVATLGGGHQFVSAGIAFEAP